jgi:hypothetical protein
MHGRHPVCEPSSKDHLWAAAISAMRAGGTEFALIQIKMVIQDSPGKCSDDQGGSSVGRRASSIPAGVQRQVQSIAPMPLRQSKLRVKRLSLAYDRTSMIRSGSVAPGEDYANVAGHAVGKLDDLIPRGLPGQLVADHRSFRTSQRPSLNALAAAFFQATAAPGVYLLIQIKCHRPPRRTV